jgi:hypothetical protein
MTPRGIVRPEMVTIKVAAFREWAKTLTPEQQRTLITWRVNLTSHLNNVSGVSADELISEILLLERKIR